MKAKTRKPRIKKVVQSLHEIKNLGIKSTALVDGALVNPEQLTLGNNALLTNPMEYIDELDKLSPFWGGVALRVLTSAIGYYAVNSILWAYRKRNQAPKIVSGIDWLNDSISEIQEKQASEENFEEQGHSKLVFVDGEQLVGGYKWLFRQITKSGDETGNFALPTPAELYNRMITRQAERAEVLDAYNTFQMEQYKNSPNFAYIEARIKASKAKNDERAIKKAQDELDHIHAELRVIPDEKFDDGVWMRLPLWAQFKQNRSIHKQIINAIASENEKPADERIHMHDLDALGKTVLLELEAANREPEVRLAFEKNVLKIENHGLMHTPPKPKQEAQATA